MQIKLRRLLLNRKLRLIVFLFIIILYAITRRLISISQEYDRLIDEIHSKKLKAVQLLTEKFLYKNWGLNELGVKPFERCEEKRCYAFKNSKFLQTPMERSDGVMVHVQNLFYMPSRSSYRRNRRQLWLFNTMEPQTLSFCSAYYNLHDLDDWFNITTTFKPQSTLLSDYKNFQNWANIHEHSTYYTVFADMFGKDENFWTKQIIKEKRPLVLWFVSHCETPSQREHLVEELRKHIRIDIFGKCRFAKQDPCHHATNKDECILDLYGSYKFYLAFENSDCAYYITEKYWKIYNPNFLFRINTIPVVRGAQLEHYQQIAPDKTRSFIFADAFQSSKSLADYLLYLDRNNSAYLEYFDWKEELFKRFKSHVTSNHSEKISNRTYRDDTDVFCEICSRLHNETYLAGNNEIVRISELFNPVRDCNKNSQKTDFYEFLFKFFGICI